MFSYSWRSSDLNDKSSNEKSVIKNYQFWKKSFYGTVVIPHSLAFAATLRTLLSRTPTSPAALYASFAHRLIGLEFRTHCFSKAKNIDYNRPWQTALHRTTAWRDFSQNLQLMAPNKTNVLFAVLVLCAVRCDEIWCVAVQNNDRTRNGLNKRFSPLFSSVLGVEIFNFIRPIHQNLCRIHEFALGLPVVPCVLLVLCGILCCLRRIMWYHCFTNSILFTHFPFVRFLLWIIERKVWDGFRRYRSSQNDCVVWPPTLDCEIISPCWDRSFWTNQ